MAVDILTISFGNVSQAGKVFLQSVITYIFVKIKKVISHNHDSLNQTQSSNGVLAVYWDMVRKCKNLQKYIFTIKIFLLLSVIIKITCWLYKICIYVIKKIFTGQWGSKLIRWICFRLSWQMIFYLFLFYQ